MTVKDIFESVRVAENGEEKIHIQFRDEHQNFICNTYVHALGVRPYLECEVEEWEPLIMTEGPRSTDKIRIIANIKLGEPVKEEQLPFPENKPEEKTVASETQTTPQTEDVIKEAKAVIKESKDVINQSPKAAGQKDFAQAPKKEKICELCGKPFHPNSGVQKYCNECKRLRDDIKKTAQELLEG